MAVYFLDSSALVKRYAQETGSAWVETLTGPQAGHGLYLARITAVEVVVAVARLQRHGSLTEVDAALALADFQHDLTYQYRLIEITATLVADAMQMATTYVLRGYDAVQLAAARQVETTRQSYQMSRAVLHPEAQPWVGVKHAWLLPKSHRCCC